MSENFPPLLRLNDFLPLLPISRSTVWAWTKTGRFPKPFKIGGIAVWKREDIQKWLKMEARDV